MDPNMIEWNHQETKPGRKQIQYCDGPLMDPYDGDLCKTSLSWHRCLGVVKTSPAPLTLTAAKCYSEYLWDTSMVCCNQPIRKGHYFQLGNKTWKSAKARKTSTTTIVSIRWNPSTTDAWPAGQIFPMASSRSEFGFILFYRQWSREYKRLPQVNNLTGKKRQIQ